VATFLREDDRPLTSEVGIDLDLEGVALTDLDLGLLLEAK
jgi:hypothetical protein